MKVRRVVTGHSSAGKAVFASDTDVDGITIGQLGSEFHRLWGGDAAPRFPDNGSEPRAAHFFPPVGGFRFSMFTVPPDSISRAALTNPAALLPELEAKLPGLADPLEPDAPGMHTTDTIDFEYVISGRVVLELDDGAKVELGPGDTVVQNGTRHAWRNPFSEPCRMVVFLVGAERTQ
jgi:mannose-6-phosphate isomerase-like protein (cupin superfamily)